MRSSGFLLFGLLWWQAAAPAQTINDGAAPDDGRASGFANTGVVGAHAPTNLSSYAPLTASERWRLYFISAYGPGAILRAAAAGGIAQWNDTPKEWKQGSEAFGDPMLVCLGGGDLGLRLRELRTSLLQLSLRLREACFGLIEFCLEWSGIDLKE